MELIFEITVAALSLPNESSLRIIFGTKSPSFRGSERLPARYLLIYPDRWEVPTSWETYRKALTRSIAGSLVASGLHYAGTALVD